MTSKKKQIRKDSFDTLTLLNRNHTEYPDCPENAKLETFPNANAGQPISIATTNNRIRISFEL